MGHPPGVRRMVCDYGVVLICVLVVVFAEFVPGAMGKLFRKFCEAGLPPM